MSTKREEPPFVSESYLTDEAIRQWARVGITVRENGTQESRLNTSYVLGATAARDHYEELVSRLRTEQEGKIKEVLEEVMELVPLEYDHLFRDAAKKRGIAL